MTLKNTELQKYLENRGWADADEIVKELIGGGFVLGDSYSEPEHIAQKAKDWLKDINIGNSVFEYAHGWSTDSWELVVGDSFNENPSAHKNIFWALVLLAKEDGRL